MLTHMRYPSREINICSHEYTGTTGTGLMLVSIICHPLDSEDYL